MYLCDIIKDLSCGNCPFCIYGGCNFKNKEDLIMELQYIFDSAKWALDKIKEAD